MSSDQQAQELTPAEQEVLRGLKAWDFGCSDEEGEGFYTGAKAALIAARPVQVERPDEGRKSVAPTLLEAADWVVENWDREASQGQSMSARFGRPWPLLVYPNDPTRGRR